MLFLSFLLVTAHVAKPLTYLAGIGKLKLIPKQSQNSLYKFQADACLAHVCFVAEYNTSLSKSTASEIIDLGKSSELFIMFRVARVALLLNFFLSLELEFMPFPPRSSSSESSTTTREILGIVKGDFSLLLLLDFSACLVLVLSLDLSLLFSASFLEFFAFRVADSFPA